MPPNRKKRHFWLYILELENGALYTGYATDLVRRFREHLAGKGARYTRSFRPVRIAQCWRAFTDPGTVLRLELLVKRLGRTGKDRLVREPARMRRLAAEKLGLRRTLYLFDPARVEKAARSAGGNPEDPFARLPRRDLP